MIQHKSELLNCVKTLGGMDYKLYGSIGTADYYMENAVKVIIVAFKNLHSK